MSSRTSGVFGEDAACDYLMTNGCEIIERNYKGLRGEIDIIARDGEYTVFVEVKMRTARMYGEPSQAVDASKQKKIIFTAIEYASKHGLMDSPLRFDVIEVRQGLINHIKGAFTA